MVVQPQPLSKIAEESGFGMADVAFLASLEESTVSRLWDDAQWLDRIKGRSLQSLVAVVPGVGEYVTRYSLADRRNRLAEKLNESGVIVDTDSFRRLVCVERVPEQYLSNALDAAVFILEGDARRAAAHLARFWGKEQDYALGFLFDTNDSGGLLVDAAPLRMAAAAIVETLAERSNSFHAIVAQANLIHHLSRTTLGARFEPEEGGEELGRHSALAFRSGVMGRLIAANDPDLALAYSRRVKASPLVAMVEDWAFPTYTHDAKPSTDFTLPRSLLLRETAAEVIREVENYNDAYLIYLAETSIPSIMKRDPTFGLRHDHLVASLRQRRETVVLPEARRACDAILSSLGAHDTRLSEGSKFDYQW